MKEHVTLLFTGDFCPHQRIEKLAIEKNYKAIFNDFINEFQKNDLNIIDLECPLTVGNSKIKKTGPHQKAHPQTASILKKLNIGLAAMANNHILDYGEQALLDTIQLCNENGVQTIGAGQNIEEAKKPFIKEIKGLRIGFLNFTEREWTIAGQSKAGANPIDLVENFNEIQSLSKKVDKVIVIAHGGNEFYHLPSPRIKKNYRFFIDAGADAVISHHTHCLSGYEVYKDAPIFYGLGNFIYDWPDKKNDNWNFGFAVRLKVDKGISFNIIPFKQNNGEELGLNYLNDEENINFENRLNHLNEIINDDRKLEAEFLKLCAEEEGVYSLYFEPYHGKILNGLRIRKLLPDLFSKKKRMLQYNILQCESHRDILLYTLKNKLK